MPLTIECCEVTTNHLRDLNLNERLNSARDNPSPSKRKVGFAVTTQGAVSLSSENSQVLSYWRCTIFTIVQSLLSLLFSN